VKCNRNSELRKINIKPLYDGLKDKEISVVNNDSSDFEIKESSKNDTEKINFKITLNKEEWAAIQNEKKYQSNNSKDLKRNYIIFKPGAWTEIVHSHFWEQTKIACTVIYKRVKIYESGFHYCVF